MARGFVQQEGIDYDDAFASVTRMESVHILTPPHGRQVRLPMATCWRRSTFVIASQEGMVLCLRKALYGLRQVLRVWNTKLDGTLREIGFQQSAHVAAMYRRGSGCSLLLVGIYVDDLVIADTDEDEVEVFKVQMKAVF